MVKALVPLVRVQAEWQAARQRLAPKEGVVVTECRTMRIGVLAVRIVPGVEPRVDQHPASLPVSRCGPLRARARRCDGSSECADSNAIDVRTASPGCFVKKRARQALRAGRDPIIGVISPDADDGTSFPG